ncbi:MAG: DUF5996 family protein [Telluria sp.]
MNPSPGVSSSHPWPPLPFHEWKDTCATLHLWTQIVGKVRLVQSPWLNHSWHVPFYVNSRGLTTSAIPYAKRSFEVGFDLVDHVLRISTSEGATRTMPLKPQDVADFYRDFFTHLAELELIVRITPTPNEVPIAIPFDEDTVHATYNPEHANRFFQVLVQADRVMKEFRARFTGKCSPVHFFWGSFDLAVTRFSGAAAPQHPGGVPNCPDWVTREAYSHEVSSCGFWPGSEAMPAPLFYAYAYPEPPGFKSATVKPAAAAYDGVLGEFVLPYEAVQKSDTPDEMVLDFFQSTYEAAANLGKWKRSELEANGGLVGRVPK